MRVQFCLAGLLLVSGSPVFAQTAPKDSCAQSDPTHINCSKWNSSQISGGGKWFGPYYSFSSGAPPPGYHLQAATFHLEGPHPCDGNDSSPVNNDPKEITMPSSFPFGLGGKKLVPNNPVREYSGHPTGSGKWSVCYLASRDGDTAIWRYSIQGIEGEDTWYIWPGTKDAGKGVLIQIDGGKNRNIKEAAKMDLVYVKGQ